MLENLLELILQPTLARTGVTMEAPLQPYENIEGHLVFAGIKFTWMFYLSSKKNN